MTDTTLDLILEAAREPEPQDDAFVMRVMAEIRQTETQRAGRRWLRRPTVIGLSAAIVVTGGAVAALVGTNPGRERAATDERPRAAIVSAGPDADARPSASVIDVSPTTAGDPVQTLVPTGRGYSTDHTSFVVDKATGVLLRTESYTTRFDASEPQRVTLTLENTGRYPVAFEASEGCALQVMATGSGVSANDTAVPDGRLDWMCAGSDADPNLPGPVETWVLAPGDTKTADAFMTLEPGSWKLNGICRCSFEQLEPTPVPKADPVTSLTGTSLSDTSLADKSLATSGLPAPELEPELSLDQPDGGNLVTPPISVRVE